MGTVTFLFLKAIFYKKDLHFVLYCANILSCQRQADNAGMAELADAYGSGPYDSNIMRVQVSFPAR